jgi:hypothetical protein
VAWPGGVAALLGQADGPPNPTPTPLRQEKKIKEDPVSNSYRTPAPLGGRGHDRALSVVGTAS